MPTQVTEYKCLLMSPSDVSEERDALTDAVLQWNAQIGRPLNVRIELVKWESHSVPDLSMPPQEVINNQLVKDCDFGIALFWSRLGTKTAKHPSGSVEEIFELHNKGARVLIYFSKRDIPQSALKDEQYEELQKLKQTFYGMGLLSQYSTIPELREKVQLNLTSVVAERLSQDRGATTSTPIPDTLTAPKPDVRIKVRHVIISLASGRHISVLQIEAQNHSPVVVYLSMIQLRLKSGDSLVMPRDEVTGEWQKRRELHPGQSFSFHIKPEHLKEYYPNLVCATASDAVNRAYLSDEQEFASAIDSLMKREEKDT
jgi:hypothetical protein